MGYFSVEDEELRDVRGAHAHADTSDGLLTPAHLEPGRLPAAVARLGSDPA